MNINIICPSTVYSEYMWSTIPVTTVGVILLGSSWNVMAHGDARKGKWRGNWRMEWVASTLHTASEHGVSSITTADAHTSAASSRVNWRSRQFKWTRPFCRKTKSGFCACAITFQLASTVCCFCLTICNFVLAGWFQHRVCYAHDSTRPERNQGNRLPGTFQGQYGSIRLICIIKNCCSLLC